ncbi:MAG TPA: DoxX family protein, partial [Saprospiraceae bacterium]|nr:DoxX family protein [Saprospiraceae bacterium]
PIIKQQDKMKHWADLLGRVLLSAIFIFEAYDSIKYHHTTLEVMAAYNITWRPVFLLNLSIFLLFAGGLMVLLGYRPKLGAFMLLLYWVPVTFIRHSFWNDPISIEREQSVHFMKNLAIIGGLIVVLVNGTGRFSIRKLFDTTKF